MGQNDRNGEVEEIRGIIERVTFRNEDSLFTVLKVRPRCPATLHPGHMSLLSPVEDRSADGDLVTAVGVVPIAEPGGTISLTGTWTVDPRFGPQFRIQQAMPIPPSTLEGIERYLGSGMVKGIGEKFAARLVRRFGTRTLDVIENEPLKLRDVPGIGPVRAERIVKAWEAQRAVRDVMLFLSSCGVTPAYAARIFRRYGRDAIATVKANPYMLAQDVFGIGFTMADRIAAKQGIRRDAPERIRAGVIFTLDEATAEGHCYLSRSELEQKASRILDMEPELAASAIAPLVAERRIVVGPGTRGSGPDDPVYPAKLEQAESGTAACLLALLSAGDCRIEVDGPRAVAWAEGKLGISFARAQRDALELSLAEKVSVITGGPGTGKTTIVRALATIIARKSGKVALAAPTGRAARRLSEATGKEAKTIHRLLRYSPQDGRFVHGADNQLRCDMLVVDEMSMVDIVLAHQLLSAVPSSARLVLVGDADQLPSVGPGNVLGDILASGRVPATRLDEIFRQAGGSMIITNAHRLNRGQMPVTDPLGGETQDFFIVERDDPAQVLATVIEMVTERIPRRWRMDPMTDVQVLTPMHRGLIGAQNLNRELGARLNPGAMTVDGVRGGHRVGDKVMQVRNNYDLDVFNGDIGRVVAADPVDRELTVDFDGRSVVYDFADTDELVPAYAVSIHKSQGSEFKAVVLVMSTSHYVMLQRNLLYTAVTRGRDLVVVVGSHKALAIALANDRVRDRNTNLAGMLQGSCP